MKAAPLLVIGLFALLPKAQAYSCAGPSICDAPADNEVVFVGVVVRQGHKARSDDQPAQPTLFRVVEPFHGMPAGTSEAEVWSGFFENFKLGSRWILDTVRDPQQGSLTQRHCGRSSRLDDGGEEGFGSQYLAFLRSRRLGSAPTTVRVRAYSAQMSRVELSSPVNVHLIGPRDYRFTLEPRGPAHPAQAIESGVYGVSAESSELPFLGPRGGSFVAKAGSCNYLTLLFGPRTSILGQIQMPDGAPATGKRVTLSAADGSGEEWMLSDDLGEFRFQGMRPGKYVVSASSLGLRDTFYPGVESRASATGLVVREGEAVEDVDFRFAGNLEVSRVALIVIGVDGNPIVSTPVSLEIKEYFEGQSEESISFGAETDYRGRYFVDAKIGARLIVSASAGLAAEPYNRSEEPLEMGEIEFVASQPEQSVEIRMTKRLCRPDLLRWEPCRESED